MKIIALPDLHSDLSSLFEIGDTLAQVDLVLLVGDLTNGGSAEDADVIYQEELVGSLDHLLFDREGGTITYLVVEAYENGGRVFVPAEWIDELVGGAITLRHWDPGQPGVPIYEAARSNDETLADLKAKLRDLGLGAVRVQVDRGVVRLEGNVRTSADKANVEVITRGTPGVIAVENALITIEEMETSPKS